MCRGRHGPHACYLIPWRMRSTIAAPRCSPGPRSNRGFTAAPVTTMSKRYWTARLAQSPKAETAYRSAAQTGRVASDTLETGAPASKCGPVCSDHKYLSLPPPMDFGQLIYLHHVYHKHHRANRFFRQTISQARAYWHYPYRG